MPVRLLQLYRLAILAAAVWLIQRGVPAAPPESTPPPPLAAVLPFFPAATSLDSAQPPRFAWPVKNHAGQILGQVLRTSPWTDALIGYAGPNDILIAESTDRTVLGISVLASGDTPGHTTLVRQDPAFCKTFTGWNPSTSSLPGIQAVSGATLTSLAIAEAVLQRLGTGAGSLRFPDPITLAEAQSLLPGTLTFDGRTARDAQNKILGHLLRTAPASDNVIGYAGPSESLIVLEPDSLTIRTVHLRRSYDSPDYVDQVRDDSVYLPGFKGRSLPWIATLDYAKEGIEGVSGATQTSYAIAEGLKRRAAAGLPFPPVAPAPSGQAWKGRDTFLTLLIAGAFLIAFTSLRGKPMLRRIWQAILIGYLGFVSADLLSLGLLTGWARHGPAWRTIPGLVLLAATALLTPWATGRQIYCHQLCPHGAAQLWLGRIRPKHLTVPPLLHRWLERLPGSLLVLAFIAALGILPLNNSRLEPFDAWSWRAAGLGSLLLAAAGLLASCLVPQAYCRYGCPTGALLKFLRTRGSSDRFTRRDTFALTCLLAAFLWTTLVVPSPPALPLSGPIVQTTASPPDSLTGSTMGTTWSLKLRSPGLPHQPLQDGIQAQLDRIENLLSTWRPDTPVSRFNQARTTVPFPLPGEILTLLHHGQSLSLATNGAYDLTTGPLVKAWGFGPPPRPTSPPSLSQLASLRTATGWEKLLLPAAARLGRPPPVEADQPGRPDSLPASDLSPAATKTHPNLEIDLTSLAEGHALDQTAAWLTAGGCTDFLLEVGGELLARGTWSTAVELPFQSLALRNASLSTSGTYRQFHHTAAGRTSHLIDPRTGYPVRHDTISVSVIATDSLTADSWATALNILGLEAALPLATRLHLAARFVTEPTPGQLRITNSPAWTERIASFPRDTAGVN